MIKYKSLFKSGIARNNELKTYMEESVKMENEINEKIVDITKIQLDKGEDNAISRIKFIYDDGYISWKPTIEKTSKIDGFEQVTKEKMTMELIPLKLRDIAKKINENEVCKVKVQYLIFNKDVDGEPKTYRFLNSIKLFDKWEIQE